MTLIEIDTDISQALAMLRHMSGVLRPDGLFAREVPRLLDVKMHEQQDEKFSSQGGWPELSEWRVRDRNATGPILDYTGSFRSRASEFFGITEATATTFSYTYPGNPPPIYFGLTAGQRRNPLAGYTKKTGKQGYRDAPIPMARAPRPILFGPARMYADVRFVLSEFLATAGFIGEGITGFGGE